MQEMKHTGKITHEQAPSIKLIKGQKDTYGWEIKVFGQNMGKVVEEVKKINQGLVKRYCKGDGIDDE